MPRRLNLPDTASVAQPVEGERLFAPSAARNAPALCKVVAGIAPRSGTALELASGTGQHIVEYARACPGIEWQPSEIEATRLASISAYIAQAGLKNIRDPLEIDATAADWNAAQHFDLIVLSNLFHLVSDSEARETVIQAARHLAPGGRFLVYGPFKRDGRLVSDGDVAFHASLTAQDAEIGYKDANEVRDWAIGAGFASFEMIEMPANNLCLVMASEG